jgi:hypothetical protein
MTDLRNLVKVQPAQQAPKGAGAPTFRSTTSEGGSANPVLRQRLCLLGPLLLALSLRLSLSVSLWRRRPFWDLLGLVPHGAEA